MKKLFFIALFALFVSNFKAVAQDNFYSIQYSVGFGSGDLGDYIGQASFRGISFEYRNMIEPKIGVGFELAYNLFYEKKDYATYTDGTASLSGIQYRYTNAFPILAAFDYYFKPNTKYNPYAGLGLGTIYYDRYLEMGLYTVTAETWQFAFRPEVGVLISANPDLDFLVALKYFGGVESSELPGQSYFTLNLGVMF